MASVRAIKAKLPSTTESMAITHITNTKATPNCLRAPQRKLAS